MKNLMQYLKNKKNLECNVFGLSLIFGNFLLAPSLEGLGGSMINKFTISLFKKKKFKSILLYIPAKDSFFLFLM